MLLAFLWGAAIKLEVNLPYRMNTLPTHVFKSLYICTFTNTRTTMSSYILSKECFKLGLFKI